MIIIPTPFPVREEAQTLRIGNFIIKDKLLEAVLEPLPSKKTVNLLRVRFQLPKEWLIDTADTLHELCPLTFYITWRHGKEAVINFSGNFESIDELLKKFEKVGLFKPKKGFNLTELANKLLLERA